MLGEGSLNLTSVRLLASHLTDENHGKLLVGACGKSKREVEELIARLFPQPDVPCSVRKLPAAKLIETPPPPIPSGAPAISRPATEPIGIQAVPSPGVARAFEPMSAVPAPTARHSLARPLAPGRYEIRFTASAGTCEKLRRTQDLLRHRIPNGGVAEIIDRALTVLLEDLARKKFAATEINRALGRRGRFWQEESFDHLVRSPDHFDRFCRYIAANGSAAGLSPSEFLYRRSGYAPQVVDAVGCVALP